MKKVELLFGKKLDMNITSTHIRNADLKVELQPVQCARVYYIILYTRDVLVWFDTAYRDPYRF